MANVQVRDHFVRKLSFEHTDTQTRPTDHTVQTTKYIGR